MKFLKKFESIDSTNKVDICTKTIISALSTKLKMVDICYKSDGFPKYLHFYSKSKGKMFSISYADNDRTIIVMVEDSNGYTDTIATYNINEVQKVISCLEEF